MCIYIILCNTWSFGCDVIDEGCVCVCRGVEVGGEAVVFGVFRVHILLYCVIYEAKVNSEYLICSDNLQHKLLLLYMGIIKP